MEDFALPRPVFDGFCGNSGLKLALETDFGPEKLRLFFIFMAKKGAGKVPVLQFRV